ncbi:surface antigen-domain-containing protein [Dunaliella salina]|uniref:Surface antigen-domain-containing protein n=1 Tax=Dunaliella salina TaxID=3046 RepID=A0ABQ7GC69_DUNSA|nr:surface antigen-domain-containing protein [Dunaliella salina]|eukprot:KAF5832207.1 surface antigen-domain-containing protein [Dunaliella salina]
MAKDPNVDYQALFEQIKTAPCKVSQVEKANDVKGEPLRTKPHLIDRELERVYAASTLEEIHAALEEAGRNLQQLGVFKRMDMLLNELPEDEPDACSLVLDLEEKNWYKVHAATYVQGNENTFEAGAGLHNITGHAEHLVASVEYGTQSSSQASLSYEQPRVLGFPAVLDARLHRLVNSHQRASSFTETLRGGALGVKSLSGRHSLQYEMGWRRLEDVAGRVASRAVLAQAGDYLKAAARYTFMVDNRDQPGAPTQGWAVRACTEVAGLAPGAGSLRFAKQQIDAQYLIRLASFLNLSFTASAGAMLPWDLERLPRVSPVQPTCIADRFFLGGPSSLRGFRTKGVGPTDTRRPQAGEPADSGPAKRDALGGDLYASVMAAANFPLPHPAFKALNAHGHIFANGGSLVQLSGVNQPIPQRVREFGNTWRWSVGAGVVLPTWVGRFEANYVAVLSAQEHDRVKRGLQLGFASSIFL